MEHRRHSSALSPCVKCTVVVNDLAGTKTELLEFRAEMRKTPEDPAERGGAAGTARTRPPRTRHGAAASARAPTRLASETSLARELRS